MASNTIERGSLNDRRYLDLLFLADSTLSTIYGLLSIMLPHRIVAKLSEHGYNHDAHEALRLYGCLRIALGWILFNIRKVDDGLFRKSTCEALCVCYLLQSLTVIRAQFTDRRTNMNWIAIFVLSTVGLLYGTFRFSRRGSMIKVYELPSNSSRSIR